MTTDEIVQRFKTIYEKRKEIQELGAARRQEEQDLVVEYKVDECNGKRNAIMARYNAQINQLQADILALESEVGTKG